MLLRKETAVYCENYAKCGINLCGEIAQLLCTMLMLKHAVTIGFKRLTRFPQRVVGGSLRNRGLNT